MDSSHRELLHHDEILVKEWLKICHFNQPMADFTLMQYDTLHNCQDTAI